MIIRFLTLLAVIGLITATAVADQATDLRQSMDKRLPAIDELKAKQVIGENNQGLVEVRQSAPGADGVVSAENHDRQAVYALIAQKTSASLDAVGRARAGVWLQDETGKWYKK